MNGKRIIFYNDAPEFGGHEIMSACFANELSGDNHVAYFYSNPKLSYQLTSKIESIPLFFQSRTGSLSLPFNVNPGDIIWLNRQFKIQKPDYVIVVQGAVDISIRGAIASRLARVKSFNYIPYHFPRHKMGLTGGWFFDHYFSWFFSLFDGVITINNHQKDLIQSSIKKKKPIYILENCVLFEIKGNNVPIIHREKSFSGKIGWIGRLDWIHKGMDCLVELADTLKNHAVEIKFVIIGDGPDADRFKKMVIEKKLQPNFLFKGWMGNRNDIYDSFDLLLITSRYEGVPLILLEAISERKPVLARLTPGTHIFQEYLPDLFLFKNISEAVEKVLRADFLIKEYASISGCLRKNVLKRHSRKQFRKNVKKIYEMIQEDFPDSYH